MGNFFAYAVLAAWPLIAIWLYSNKTIQKATLWTILGGFMFLPVKTAVDLPFIPPLGKNTVPVVSALIGCWFIKHQKIAFFRNKGLLKALVLLIFIVPFITTELNKDNIVIAGTFLPGLTQHDAFSSVLRQFLFIAPFFIGRRFFRSYDDQLFMFKTLVIAGLFYSFLELFEIRMSPQLHSWIYGYFPSSFGQQMREGGFRPVVFMGHGLLVAFFTSVVLLASVALWQIKEKIRNFSPAIVSYYLLCVLILCKTLAALAYGLFAFVAIKKTTPKMQHRMAMILVLITLLYPTLRILDIFPVKSIMEVATSISTKRAQSLGFRFDNEDVLLTHARKRFFFGWGGWGRNRVYNQNSGRDMTVTDGKWIITLGVFGWVGFMAEFGLLAIPIFRAYKASKLLKDKQEKIVLAAHAILVGVIMVDQIPNASLEPWLWLLAGILLGRVETINKSEY